MRSLAALAFGLVMAGAIIVIGLHVYNNSHQPDPGLVVLQPPAATPLPRDSGPKNNTRSTGRKRTTRSSGSSPAATPRAQRPQSRTQTRRVPVKTRPTPRPKPPRPSSPPSDSPPPQTTTPPPQSQRPPSTVEINPPVGPTVCNPLVSIRCP